MKSISLLYLLCLCPFLFLNAQAKLVGDDVKFNSTQDLLFIARPATDQENNYINKRPIEFEPIIITSDNRQLFKTMGWYDIQNEIVVIKIYEKLYLLSPEEVLNFSIHDLDFHRYQITLNDTPTYKFGEKLVDGPLQLFTSYVFSKQSKQADQPFVKMIEAAKPLFFIQAKGEEQARMISPNRSLITKVFPNHRKKIKNFIRDQKLHSNKRADLIQIAEYYNSIE